MSTFERRRILTRDLPTIVIEKDYLVAKEVISQILSAEMAQVFYAMDPLPRYNVDILMIAMRQVRTSDDNPVDVQLTTLVHLIKCAVNQTTLPRAARDGAAEAIIRLLDLPAPFKLVVKQQLYDRGQLDDPTMAVLYHFM